LTAAYLANRGIEAFLAGVSPADGPTLAMACGVAAVMTMAGSSAAILRALRVDPSAALRAE
jgi:hypothetical protein